MFLRFLILLHGLLFFSHSTETAKANPIQDRLDQDAALIDGLRERRLFGLATNHCQTILATNNLSPTERTDFTIEQIQTYSAQAILSSDSGREQAWELAELTAADFLTQYPDHPKRLLIRVQSALTHLAHGRLIRQEIEADLVDESMQQKALIQLRSAKTALNEIERAITKTIPEIRNLASGQHDLTTNDLFALNKQVRYHIAITNINLAQLYPANDRLNRIDALNNVLDRLSEVQRETSPEQRLWKKTQFLQIECLRLLGKFDLAQNRINSTQKSLGNDSPHPDLVQQQLLLSHATNDQAAAQRGLLAAKTIDQRTPALDLASVKAMISLAEQTTGSQKSSWLAQAAKLTQEIEIQHGNYWGRRAELVLIGNAQPNNMTPVTPTDSATQFDLLVRLANRAFEKERYEDAAKAYARAAQMANQLNLPDRSFALEVRTAQANEKLARHQQASTSLTQLAVQRSEHELASSVHLRGCWNWAKHAGQDKEKLKTFRSLLEQHLQHWPQADSANQIRYWLAGQLQTEHDWRGAFTTYAAVVSSHSLFPDSIELAVNCAKEMLKSSNSESENNKTYNEISKQLSDILRATTPASKAHDHALLALIEIGIEHGSLDRSSILEPLRRISTTSENKTLQLKAATWLLILEATSLNSTAPIEPLLNAISQDSIRLQAAEQGIRKLSTQLKSQQTDSVCRTRLAIIETALQLPQSESEQTAWLSKKAAVFADQGNHTDALNVFENLEKKHPRDAGLQLQIARSLTQIYRSESPEKPLARWRRLATQLKPHTAGWYEAKYHVALMLAESGQKDAARKVLEYLQAIPPGWQQSRFKNKFETLLKNCIERGLPAISR